MSRGNESICVRHAEPNDMPAVCAIINHFIRNSWVNFRTQPQTSEEWLSDWQKARNRYPWLVATSTDGTVVGVAYAAMFRAREAYNWCAEVTVYVAPDLGRRGVGTSLYKRLIPMLEQQGYRTLVAVIALPNSPSVALHEAFGFEHVGTLHSIGFKFGAWHDTGFWQRMLGSDDGRPVPVIPLR